MAEEHRARKLWDGGRLLAVAGGVCGLVVLLVPWWRNHALLLDFCDYGLVMAAVGRMSSGEHPYVDFITPIQTLQFLLSHWAENLWGARYLSLTYMNAAFIAASFLVLAAVLRKSLGAGLALLVAAAVVAASSSQHTIVWYNAMGTVWLALVLWLTAEPGATRPERVGRLIVVGAALWLGGMTKLTYQIAALAFAFAFTFRSAWKGELSWRHARWTMVSFVVFGVIAPIATELASTRATLDQWLYNVVLLPARFRTGMLWQIFSAKFYLHTPHDYYRPLHFTYAGVWGLGLLMLIGALAGYGAVRRAASRAKEATMLVVLLVGAWICGGVLLATNMDIAYLSGAAWLVFAVGLSVAYTPRATPKEVALVRGVLAVAALSLLVPAWSAAWKGTRALWGHEPMVRTDMVSTNDLPSRFGYLRGMKISASMHGSLKEWSAMMDAHAERGIPPGAYYFANATEWMVRVVPEARHAGLPLWLAGGTTYSAEDAWTVARRIERGDEIEVITAHDAWNYWYPEVQNVLAEGFRTERAGERIFSYVRRERPDPLEFAVNTQSNLYWRGAHVWGVAPEVRLGPRNLFYLGGRDPHRIDFAAPLYRLSGEAVGERTAGAGTEPVQATFRVYAREGSELKDLLWAQTVELAAGTGPVTLPFAVSPGGRPVSLVLQLPAGSPADVGWRRLDTQHSGPHTPEPPAAVNRRLGATIPGAREKDALFGGEEKPAALVAYGAVQEAGEDGLTIGAPGELWFRMDAATPRISGEYQFKAATQATAPGVDNVVRIAVIYYKSGRFDVLERRELRPGTLPADRGPHRFEIHVPEGVGWCGLVVTTPAENRAPSGGVTWRDVRLR